MINQTLRKPEMARLIAIFLLALILRLGYLVFLKQNYFFYDHPSADVVYYQEWAEEIAFKDWFGSRAFYGLPLYPYFLGSLKRLALNHTAVIRFFHLILGAANCLLVYVVARRIFSSKTAVLAAALTATNFILIYYDWLMMPVTLLIFLSLIIVWIALDAKSIVSGRDWFIYGLIIGLAILGDGKFLLFLPFLVFYFYQQFRYPLKEFLLKIFLPIFLGLFIVVFGVCLRNKAVSGDWVFISAQSGLSLYAGNNPDASGVYENPDFIRPTHTGQDEDQKIIAEDILQKKLSPNEVSHFWRSKALVFISESPLDYLSLLANKFTLFFTETERAHDIDLILQREWRKKGDFNPFYVICPFALLGGILAARKFSESNLINGLIVCQLVFTLIFFLTTRHRASVLPFLIILESYCFIWLIEQIQQKKFRAPALLLTPVALLFFFLKPVNLEAKTVRYIRAAKSGPVFEKRQQYREAQQAYFEALQLQPNDTNTLYNLGNSYFLLEDYTSAMNYYKQAIQLCHYHVDALFNLGYTYELLDSPGRALQTYQQVLTYQPDTPDAHFRMANIYKIQGRCSEATTHYEKIKEIMPSTSEKIDNLIQECR